MLRVTLYLKVEHTLGLRVKKYRSILLFFRELTRYEEDSIAEKKEVPGIKTLNNPYVPGTIKKREGKKKKF